MKRLIPLITTAALLLAACDGDSEAKTETRNINPGAVITVSNAAATPAAATAGSNLLLSLGVTAQNPVQAVTIDLASIAGADDTPMHDDGSNGDVTSADGVFSLEYALPASGLSVGTYFLPFQVEDSAGFTYAGSIAFNILNSAPVISATAGTIANADGTRASS